MRAISTRRLAGSAAALLIVGATLLMTAGVTTATVPDATPTSRALPGTFSAGNSAGFEGTFTYEDGSTLAKLYLVINTTGAASNTYLSVEKNGRAVSGCTPGVTVSCVFKTVRLGDRFVVRSAYAPGEGVTEVTATFVWSTTGATSSDGGTSHGDTWPTEPVKLSSTLSTDSTNFGGGFIVTNGAGVGNAQSVSSSNRQAAKLASLPAGVPATVLDGPSAQDGHACGTVDCSTAFGEWVEVEVADGDTLGTAFQIVITYYQGAPKAFVHEYVDDNDVTQYEPILACAKKSPTIPCFTWNPRTNQATITTFHNGSWRGL
jgi:hypothetical protein